MGWVHRRSPAQFSWSLLSIAVVIGMIIYIVFFSTPIKGLTQHGIHPIWLTIIIILGIVCSAFVIWIVRSYLVSNGKNKKELSSILFVIVIALAICILITVNSEYTPGRYSSYDMDNNNMSVSIDVPSPLLIPIKNLQIPIEKNISVTISNLDKGIEIQNVKLLSPENSTINVNEPEFKKNLPQTSQNKSKFFTTITTKNKGDIYNKKDNYTVDISYLDHRKDVGSEKSPSCDTELTITNVIASGRKSSQEREAFTVDKNTATRWSSASPSWITYDLGSQNIICSIDILWYKGDTRHYYSYLSLSKDNNKFFKLTGSDNGTHFIVDNKINQTGRYLRVTSNGNNDTDYVSINETRIFGNPSIAGLSKDTKDTSMNSIITPKLYHSKITFPWNIASLDLNLITYFWIVMTGVVTSRFLDFLLVRLNKEDVIDKKIEEQFDKYIEAEGSDEVKIEYRISEFQKKIDYHRDNILQDLHWKELLWIVFSFIISILVFAGFKQNVALVNSVLINISIAFGFGFAFDRTLQMATRFKSIYTSD